MSGGEITESGIKFSFVVPPILADRIKPDSVYKSVDFILEFPAKTVFIEVKNFRNSSGAAKSSNNEHKRSVSTELVYKFRDTLLWRYFCDAKSASVIAEKPLVYIALIENQQKYDYLEWERGIACRLPVRRPKRHGFCDEFHLLTVKTWNTRFRSALGEACFIE